MLRITIIGVLLHLAIGCSNTGPFEKEYAAYRSIKPGMTEADVLAVLGHPDHQYTKATAPDDYYVKGYSHKRREITGKVFIYIGPEPIAYVYLDDNNIVEHVFVG